MADKSAIEWTDATWNPTVGCSIVSPGCTNCYAMKVANGLERRFDSPKYRGLTKVVNGNAVWTGEVRLDEAALLQPLKWKRGRRIFVNSMSDLFHESLSDADIDRVFAVMALCPQHTFQVLTKRSERMRRYMQIKNRCHVIGDVMLRLATIRSGFKCVPWPFPNVWLGISAERQEEADTRLVQLVNTPATIRFVSYEPALGPLLLQHSEMRGVVVRNWLGVGGIDWVICGGESGPRARPMHPQWARDLRDQCDAAGIAFFFKQWGEWGEPILGGVKHLVSSDGRHVDDRQWDKALGFHYPLLMSRIGKKAAGRLLDGREHNEFPVTEMSVAQSGVASQDENQKEAARA